MPRRGTLPRGDYTVTVYHQGREAIVTARAARPAAADETTDDRLRPADALAGIEQYLIHIQPAT